MFKKILINRDADINDIIEFVIKVTFNYPNFIFQFFVINDPEEIIDVEDFKRILRYLTEDIDEKLKLS